MRAVCYIFSSTSGKSMLGKCPKKPTTLLFHFPLHAKITEEMQRFLIGRSAKHMCLCDFVSKHLRQEVDVSEMSTTS